MSKFIADLLPNKDILEYLLSIFGSKYTSLSNVDLVSLSLLELHHPLHLTLHLPSHRYVNNNL